jgi:hypothetical protein
MFFTFLVIFAPIAVVIAVIYLMTEPLRKRTQSYEELYGPVCRVTAGDVEVFSPDWEPKIEPLVDYPRVSAKVDKFMRQQSDLPDERSYIMCTVVGDSNSHCKMKLRDGDCFMAARKEIVPTDKLERGDSIVLQAEEKPEGFFKLRCFVKVEDGKIYTTKADDVGQEVESRPHPEDLYIAKAVEKLAA